ncbi:alpha/beta fold hydrolase [Tropicimonas marinistellae]|uniref:alpha/beta fold hydrolase n=1 Tax=Tropicimonas marinistellae TaxID=1739787 RepID=UPI00082F93E1|nr:alpha/beta hydrolase [Tropicimonas marinistellae]
MKRPDVASIGVFVALALLTLTVKLAMTPAISHSQVADLPPVQTPEGVMVDTGIVSLERLTLGGVEQTVLIRGQSADNPVLLFLHGGPGGAIIPWVPLFQTPELEAAFTVVHWDQRGAGSSYSDALTAADITPDQFVRDTLELTNLLRDRFGQDRIFLAGQSWGSALGFMTIAEDSTPYHAFIAISERVAWERSHEIGFDWVKMQASSNGDDDILAALQKIEPFDALDEADLIVQRQAVAQYGGGDYHTEGLEDRYLDYAISGQSPYYSEADIQAYMPGLELSSKAIESAELLAGYDLFENFPSATIPVHFITGTEDWNTPAVLAKAYHDALEAPDKSFTAIDGAAHMVMFDQPDAWTETMIAIKDRTLLSR